MKSICMFQVLIGCMPEGKGDREEVFARINQGFFRLIINLNFMKADNVKVMMEEMFYKFFAKAETTA